MDTSQELAARYKAQTQELTELYPKATTEKEKAEIEEALWNANPHKQGASRRDYLTGLIGGKPGLTTMRATIMHTGSKVSQLLWDLTDSKGMSLYTVLRLLRDSRAQVETQKIELFDALVQILKEYETSSFHSSTTPSGKSIRKRSGSKLRSFAHVKTGYKQKKSSKTSGSLWAVVRNAFSEEMATRLVGIDSVLAEKLWREFEAEMKVVIDSLQSKISRLKTRELEGAGFTNPLVPRRDVLHACKTLHMDPPAQGKPVDLKLANKKKKTLAKLYHPDYNHGDTSNTDRYTAVIASYELLESYMAMLEGNKNQTQSTTAVD